MEFNAIGALFMTANESELGSVPGYVSTEGARISRERMDKALEQVSNADKDIGFELEDAVLLEEAEWERQGFINGFRMGVQLMRECTCQVIGGEAV